MAIQNFLSGGYYGKLGATVGQRWKNKRTIRTYVVPANPRTPTQQANRGKFADAVTYAQMGMQMNYYCTLFDDPNFTKWNYRMKVARELKNAGLSGLDLIPLYPVSFNPPILLTEFTKSTVSGQKHISFAAPDLALNADRVLSLMFALYDEQDTFLGYKLYLGYYYASNPGYVEVDVDDVDEINTHCFVRIISNDDEDSATDLIGSPRLAVGGSSIDIHTFNKTIRNVQKSTTGITITFAEPWKGVPTINEINFDLVCVVNGESVTLDGTGYTLFENNGYCAVTFEHAGLENQMLPAFPLGSGLANLTVDYEGASWQITIEDATEAYEDSDLSRSFISTVSSIARSGTTFSVVFGETLPAVTSRNLTLAIRAVKNGAWVTENVAIASIADDTITFEQSGASGANIYAFPSGATVTLTGTITGNGVVYTADTQTAQSVSNADLSRSFSSAISSIARSGTTFSVVFGETLPAVTSRNLTLAIRAVKNGAWVTENVAIASIADDTITFEQSGASGANIYAFPSGATVTLTGTITGNGVVYTADTQTAQSVSNADLSRSFSSAISSIARSGTTFNVVLGAALPTITSRNLTLAVRAVKNGAWVNESVAIASASGTSITFEQSGASGANIYAFPSGATVTLAGAVTSNGVTYTADTQTAQSVSNADLSRSILSTPTWNPSSTSDITFTVAFGGTIATQSVTLSMVCSGRLGLRTAENQTFNVVGADGYITFTCTGNRKQNPMNTSGDKITLTAQNFVCNGVTYTLTAQDVNLRNAITDSYYLETLAWTFEKIGGNEVGQELEDLSMSAVLPFSRSELEIDLSALFTVVIDSALSQYCVPYHSAFEVFEYKGQTLLNLHSEFSGQEYAEDVDTSKQVLGETLALLVEGVTYKWHSQWYSANVPSTVGGFTG